MARIERCKNTRKRYAKGELALFVLISIALLPSRRVGMIAQAKEASEVFPICKRYREGQRRQQEDTVHKGTENRPRIRLGLDDDTEDRILRRRQGNKTQSTAKKTIRANNGRQGGGGEGVSKELEHVGVNVVRRNKMPGSGRANNSDGGNARTSQTISKKNQRNNYGGSARRKKPQGGGRAANGNGGNARTEQTTTKKTQRGIGGNKKKQQQKVGQLRNTDREGSRGAVKTQVNRVNSPNRKKQQRGANDVSVGKIINIKKRNRNNVMKTGRNNGNNRNSHSNGRAGSYNYCGKSWEDANSKCNNSCPSGMDNECPIGETCYADTNSCPFAPGDNDYGNGNNNGNGGKPGKSQSGQGYKPFIGYYPNFDEESCVNDDKYPNYMRPDPQFYFSTTINECCRLHYKGKVKPCIELSMHYAKKHDPTFIWGHDGWHPPGSHAPDELGGWDNGRFHGHSPEYQRPPPVWNPPKGPGVIVNPSGDHNDELFGDHGGWYLEESLENADKKRNSARSDAGKNSISVEVGTAETRYGGLSGGKKNAGKKNAGKKNAGKKNAGKKNRANYGPSRNYRFDRGGKINAGRNNMRPGNRRSFNYCGRSFADANSKCSIPCPNGMDRECPMGETCFASANACPAASGVDTNGNDRFNLGPGKSPWGHDEWWHGGAVGGKSGKAKGGESEGWHAPPLPGWQAPGKWNNGGKAGKAGRDGSGSGGWQAPPPSWGGGGGGSGGKSGKAGGDWGHPPRPPTPIKCDHWGGSGSHTGHWGGSTDPCIPSSIPTYYPTYNNIPTYYPTYFPEPTPRPTDPTTYLPTFGTYEPTYDPTYKPSYDPTYKPSYDPTYQPSYDPTYEPTYDPTYQPTILPTRTPTMLPTLSTYEPTTIPTMLPTISPTAETPLPTMLPTYEPSYDPTYEPTYDPTYNPTTISPTAETPFPTAETFQPTNLPTLLPTMLPTISSTVETPFPTADTFEPTTLPTLSPTFSPTISPTVETPFPTGDTFQPTNLPTQLPTLTPTFIGLDPTLSPSLSPTSSPTLAPTISPSLSPTFIDFDPTLSPSLSPTFVVEDPTLSPSQSPTSSPTLGPSLSPTFIDADPTESPTFDGGFLPTVSPTFDGGFLPTVSPTFIDEEREIFVWGAPQSIGESLDVDLLIPQEAGEFIIDASAGQDYTLFVLSDGSVAAGGYIERPEEYQGHFGCGCQILEVGVNELLPIVDVVDLDGVEVAAPEFKKVVAGVESFDGSGRMHSIFIDVNGEVYASGNNDKGQLCLGDEDSRIYPTQIQLPDNEIAIDAVVGGDFTLILTASRKIFGCGSNELGQLGLGNGVSKTDLPDDGNDLNDVRSISAGRDFALIRTDNGLFVMGDNTFGQLCLDTGGDERLIPTPLVLNSDNDPVSSDDVRSFKAGKESTYILFRDGSVIACGLNDVGQLGDGTFDDSFGSLVQLPTSNIVAIGSGPSAESVFYITNDDEVYGNGLNNRGQLGVGDTEDSNSPVKVDFPSGTNIRDISASDTHTVSW